MIDEFEETCQQELASVPAERKRGYADAVRLISGENRPALVAGLLQYCKDRLKELNDTNKEVVLSVLHEWSVENKDTLARYMGPPREDEK